MRFRGVIVAAVTVLTVAVVVLAATRSDEQETETYREPPTETVKEQKTCVGGWSVSLPAGKRLPYRGRLEGWIESREESPEFTILLQGQIDPSVRSGRYTLVVTDRTASDDFHLWGPGVDVITSGVGRQRFQIELRAGEYTFAANWGPTLREHVCRHARHTDGLVTDNVPWSGTLTVRD